jgi:ABC-type glycerol-3-phosphate transport system substrate-binding protein
MKKVLFPVLMVVALLAVSLAAPVAAQKTDVKLTLWTHDGLYVKFFGARAEEWKANYPDINFTFDFQVVPSIFDVVLANIAAGAEIPDLFGLEQGAFPRFMEGGIIEQKFLDLTDLIGDERELFIEGRWTPYTYEGRIYGVESGFAAMAYYYQPEIFEANGVEVPTTWNEFLTAGEALAANGINIGILTDDANGAFMQFFLQRGGQVFDEVGNFILPEPENRQIALESLNFMKQALDSGIYFLSVAGDFWGPSPITAFREGKVAGVIMPDWYSDYILKPQAEDMAGKWRIAPMPVWDDGVGYETSVWGGTGFVIAKDSPNAELAWDLLHYSYMTKENQLKRFEEINYFPHMIEAFEDPRIVDRPDPYYGGQEIGEIFAAVADSVPVWYQSQFRAAFQDAMTAELVRFYNNEITAEELLDNVINVVEDEIAFS